VIDLTTLDFERTILIAEIGGNHDGQLDRAYELARQAAGHGADIVKFQSFHAEGLVNRKVSPDRYRHYGELELPLEEWPKLARHVESLGCHFMTSVWDEHLLDALDELLPAYKVGSGDFTNFPLIERMLQTGKPLILSTAMCDEEDIDTTMAFIDSRAPGLIDSGKLALLQCTAMYDEPSEDEANLAVMTWLRERYGVPVGYSNHAVGTSASVLAAGMGAAIIEVHFTDDKTGAYRDKKLSFTASELAMLRETVEAIPRIRGVARKDVRPSELEIRNTFRRAVYFRRPAPKGHVVTAEDLVCLRPNEGIDARRYHDLIGKRTTTSLEELAPLSETDFE
jgi:N-acetylneuraminate synthase/N,N'-diacetyllegionaminate synthase